MTSESLSPGAGIWTRFQPRTRLRKFSVEELVVDERLQTRAALNQAVLRDYAKAMGQEQKFPPLLVGIINDVSYVVDGFHRLEAAKLAGLTELQAETFEGTWQEGLESALGANTTHGCRRTNADKRKAVSLALVPFWDKSDTVIADLCGVADRFVAKMRKTVQVANGSPPLVRAGRDGKLHAVRPNQTPATASRSGEASTASAPVGPKAVTSYAAALVEVVRFIHELAARHPQHSNHLAGFLEGVADRLRAKPPAAPSVQISSELPTTTPQNGAFGL